MLNSQGGICSVRPYSRRGCRTGFSALPLEAKPSHLRQLRCSATAFTIFDRGTQQTHTFDRDLVHIGSSQSCELRLVGDNILDKHAQFERRGRQLYCRPTLRDAGNFLIDTHTWLNGNPLRQDVAYSAASGATISFGEPENEFRLEYEQAVGQKDILMDQLIKSYARAYNKDEQAQLPDDIRKLL